MAYINTTQAGDWSDTSTWDGGVKPGISDEPVIYHDVVMNETITTGKLWVHANITTSGTGLTFTFSGGISQTTGNITIGAGNTVIGDVGGSMPEWHVGSYLNPQYVEFQGTSGSHCVVQDLYFFGYYGLQRATYTNFTRVGDATHYAFNPKMTGWGPTDVFSMSYCTFTHCGQVQPQLTSDVQSDGTVIGTDSFLIDHCTFTASQGTKIGYYEKLAGTGTGSLTYNDFDIDVVIITSAWTLSNNIFRSAWHLDGVEQPSNVSSSAVLATDTFTDTAATDLGSHEADTGESWARHPSYSSGAAEITAAGRLAGVSGTALYVLGLDPSTADYGIEADFVTVSQAGTTSLWLRLDTTALTGYEVRVSSSVGIVSLVRWNGGSSVEVRSWSYTFGVSSTHRVRATVRTYTITYARYRIAIVIDGVVLGHYDFYDSTGGISAAGRPGVSFSSVTTTTGVHIDNLAAGNPAADTGVYYLRPPMHATGPPGAPIGGFVLELDQVVTLATAVTITPTTTVAGTFSPATSQLSDTDRIVLFDFIPDAGTETETGDVSVTSTGSLDDPAAVGSFTVGWLDVPGRSNFEQNMRGSAPNLDGTPTTLGPYFFWYHFGSDTTRPGGTEEAGSEDSGHYDPLWCFLQARRYAARQLAAGNSEWVPSDFDQGIAAALYQQGIVQVVSLGGALAGHHAHTRGFYQHWLEFGDDESLAAGLLVHLYAQFNNDYFDSGPPTAEKLAANIADSLSYPLVYCRGWRENAYAGINRMTIEWFGQDHTVTVDYTYQRIVSDYGHLDQLINVLRDNILSHDPSHTDEYIQPIMTALALRSAIMYVDYYRPVADPTARIKAVIDFLWDEAWVDHGKAEVHIHDALADGEGWCYVNKYPNGEGSGDRYEAESVLNQLIVPAYYWYYLQSGDLTYRQRGDRAFRRSDSAYSSSFTGGNHKQWNQNYLWSIQGLYWREQGDQALGHLDDYGGIAWPTATAYTVTPPTTMTGRSNAPSGLFVVALDGWPCLAPGGILVVTPNDGEPSAGGSFYPATVRLTTDRPDGVFRYVPASSQSGAVSISFDNDQLLSDPGSLTYTVSGTALAATGLVVVPPVGRHPALTPSDPFTVRLDPSGSVPSASLGAQAGVLAVTYQGGDQDPPWGHAVSGDLMAPNEGAAANGFGRVALTAETPQATFTYAPLDEQPRWVYATKNDGFQDSRFTESYASPVPYTAYAFRAAWIMGEICHRTPIGIGIY